MSNGGKWSAKPKTSLVSNFSAKAWPNSTHWNSGSMRNPGRWVLTAWICILRKPCDLCIGKSRVNSGYLWVRLHVRACLAIFANCWRPHSVSWSRPERQHPWEKERARQINLMPSNTRALKHAVISAEKHEFFFADRFSTEDPAYKV